MRNSRKHVPAHSCSIIFFIRFGLLFFNFERARLLARAIIPRSRFAHAGTQGAIEDLFSENSRRARRTPRVPLSSLSIIFVCLFFFIFFRSRSADSVGASAGKTSSQKGETTVRNCSADLFFSCFIFFVILRSATRARHELERTLLTSSARSAPPGGFGAARLATDLFDALRVCTPRARCNTRACPHVCESTEGPVAENDFALGRARYTKFDVRDDARAKTSYLPSCRELRANSNSFDATGSLRGAACNGAPDTLAAGVTRSRASRFNESLVFVSTSHPFPRLTDGARIESAVAIRSVSVLFSY